MSQHSTKVKGFSTVDVPFPNTTLADISPPISMPCIGFNYLGQLISGQDEYIPIAHGSVLVARTPTKQLIEGPVSFQESPPNNSILNYNLIHIDWLTGRATVEHQRVQ